MRPITFAHRGGAAHRRENTLDAFEHARSLGATGLESDVRLSADGVPVLSHGHAVRHGLRRRKIGSTDAATLAGFDIPTLATLYGRVGTAAELSLDVKVPEAGVPSVEVAREVGEGAVQRLWLCSPDLELLSTIRSFDDEVRLVHSTTYSAIGYPLEQHAARLADGGIDAFNLHRSEWSGGLVVLFHRFAVKCFAWDAQEVRHLREVLSYGVDAVYSDHVDRMVATVSEWTSVSAEPREPPPGTHT